MKFPRYRCAQPKVSHESFLPFLMPTQCDTIHETHEANFMCLAIPGKIERVEEDDVRTGVVSFGGVSKKVCLALVPEAGVGDYVIVHVGFAISKVNEQAAKESLALLEEMDQANGTGIPPS